MYAKFQCQKVHTKNGNQNLPTYIAVKKKFIDANFDTLPKVE